MPSINSLTALRVLAGTKDSPHRIPTVRIVQKVPSTTNTIIHKHHHHGGEFHPSYGVGLMDLPNPREVTSSEGVGQGCLGWV